MLTKWVVSLELLDKTNSDKELTNFKPSQNKDKKIETKKHEEEKSKGKPITEIY